MLRQIGKTAHYRVVKADGSAQADLPTDVTGGWQLHEATEARPARALLALFLSRPLNRGVRTPT